MEELMISIRNLTYRYKKALILDHINLGVDMVSLWL